MTYTPPASQEDLDRIIADRLTRQKEQIEKQFAGFDDLKAKAAEYDKAQEAAKSELQKAVDRAAAAEKERDDLKAAQASAAADADHKKQIATWADEVSKETHVPASLLRGATKEELAAHAAELKPVIVANRNGVVPNEGKQPTNTTSEEREAVAKLFGSN